MPAVVSSSRKSQQGVSLVESVIAIVIIGIALAAVSRGMGLALRHNADPLWQARATQLVHSYMDDVMALRFQEDSPTKGGAVGSCVIGGTEGGEHDRTDYDDVDDYNGLNEAGQFLDTSVTSNAAYQIQISVTCADAQGASSSTTKLIQVVVTGPDGQQLRLAALRGDF
ncbi:prepilin-type N-terminal cleavage/methylation domain-containing protein [Oceanobacter mangrovi]|uniref:prepilin-type N-terminal cleavage/methylation domain-containing protein n=1 Tax=Oceanobacter mangrovi TaxID=2862510 RepID=UPI001C8E3D4F|nr:prepilin-type N-terminal cleavage/methylation domain-containing protein [Oceanobacter mangrovi]